MNSNINSQTNVGQSNITYKYTNLMLLRIKALVSSAEQLSPTRRGYIALVCMFLVSTVAFTPLFPRSVTPASAPLDVFSGERAMAHLPIIASEPHPAGSPAQAVVGDYLVQQLTNFGIEVEVQQEPGLENVVARLYGTDPTGAILLQAHYDSVRGPGAGDNGSGVAALLEVARTLSAGPALRNDVIILFDDSEELPVDFAGTKAFIRKHRWMDDVRVAIGMDTAVEGFICVDDTGTNNGWLVQALARAYTGGAWTSVSGGGNYDTQPFRNAGIRVLELESNYPFHEQHTPDDVPSIVNPGTVQQMGEQVLSVVRELTSIDLSNTSGEQETFIHVPLVGLAHYPEIWALPLAILAGILLVSAWALTLWRKLSSWRGAIASLLVTIISAGLAGLGANLLWKAAPDWFSWETQRWLDWPEVIPPFGWEIFIFSYLVVLVLTAVFYRLARRWSERGNFSLVGLSLFFVIALAVAMSTPRAAIIFTWPVLIGSVSWILAAVMHQHGETLLPDTGALVAAIPTVMYLLPLLPVTFMSDGTKSVMITTAVLVVVLGIIFPVVDSLLVRPMTVNH